MRMLNLLLLVSFLFVKGFSQNSPLNKDYLKVEWDNPTSSATITSYMVYRFNSADTLNPLDSVSHTYNSEDDYGIYFSSITLNDTAYFRIISRNDSASSDYSELTTGIIDTTFQPQATLQGDSIKLSWTSFYSGETSHKWLKLSADVDSILSVSDDYYIDIENSNNTDVEVSLGGLTPDTEYFYVAFEVNADGNCISSDLRSFTYNSSSIILKRIDVINVIEE